MKENKYISVSLLHDTERDGRSFLSLVISILFHLLIAGGIIFVPQYIPAYAPNPGFSPSSVINVSMVTLPAEEGVPDTNAEDNAVPEKNASESEEPEPVNSSEPEKPEETVTVVEPEKTEEAAVEPEKPEIKIPEPEKPEKTVVHEPEKPKEAVVPKPEKLKEKKPKFEKPKIIEKLKEKPENLPKKEETKKDKTPDKRVAAKEPESDRVSGAPKDAIERIRQSLKKSSTAQESGIGSGHKGTGTGSGGEGTDTEGGGNGGFGSIFGRKDSDALRFYRENVIPDAVNRNWAFSESMTHRRFNLEAVIVIRIMANGEITDIWFEKKSGDKYFDDSAYKAVIKSNPLPALPVGYGPYKVGLRFTPSGMK